MNTVQEAELWLDQIYNELNEDPRYKYGEDFLQRLKWEIHRYNPELQQAIKVALGSWLSGNNRGKIDAALILLPDLQATEYIPIIEKMRDDITTGHSSLPMLWLPLTEIALRQLRDVKEN